MALASRFKSSEPFNVFSHRSEAVGVIVMPNCTTVLTNITVLTNNFVVLTNVEVLTNRHAIRATGWGLVVRIACRALQLQGSGTVF